MGEPQYNVPEKCPIKEINDALGAKLKQDFSCDICIVSRTFCHAYRNGEPWAVAFQKRSLEMMTKMTKK